MQRAKDCDKKDRSGWAALAGRERQQYNVAKQSQKVYKVSSEQKVDTLVVSTKSSIVK